MACFSAPPGSFWEHVWCQSLQNGCCRCWRSSKVLLLGVSGSFLVSALIGWMCWMLEEQHDLFFCSFWVFLGGCLVSILSEWMLWMLEEQQGLFFCCCWEFLGAFWCQPSQGGCVDTVWTPCTLHQLLCSSELLLPGCLHSQTHTRSRRGHMMRGVIWG